MGGTGALCSVGAIWWGGYRKSADLGFGWRELGKLGAGAQICRVFVLRRVCGGACCGWCVGRVLWLRSISCSPLDGGRIPPRRCYLVGRVQKIGRFWFWGRVTCGNRGGGGKSAGFLYGWASEDGAWARCVWGVGGMRVGRRRGVCTGLGKFAPLKRSDLGKWEREVQMCQNQCIFHAPPAHLLPQYCTLLGKTRHRHQPRTGRRLQTVRPGTSATPDPAAPAPPVRTACRPGTAGSHRLPAPSGTASSYRLPTPPGTTRPPANPNPTCKQRNAAPTKR